MHINKFVWEWLFWWIFILATLLLLCRQRNHNLANVPSTPMLTLTGRVESHVSKSNKFLSFAQFSHLLLPPALVSVHPSWWLSSESVEMPSAVRTDGVRPVRQSDVITLIREAALQIDTFCAASGFAAARVLKSFVKWTESCIGFLQKCRKCKIAAYFQEIFEEFWENSEANFFLESTPTGSSSIP